MHRPALAVLCAALALAACSEPVRQDPYPQVDADRIRTHVERLTAAEQAGASAGSQGERLAAAYLTSEFGAMGLQVENQTVPISRITPRVMTFSTQGGAARTLRPGDDFVAWTRRREPQVEATAQIVFAGYGISASRQGWDDYKTVDVRGKIVLLLSGDPLSGTRHRLGPVGRDVYAGREYKFEEAARRGAIGVFLIHQPGRTRPWPIIRRESAEVQDLDQPSRDTPPAVVEGWMTESAAAGILAGAGKPFSDLVDLAKQTNFEPVTLPEQATVKVTSEIASTSATNIVATLDPQATDSEAPAATLPYVLYSTHWNDLPEHGGGTGHLAWDAEGNEPPGAAVMLEVARALARETPRRGFVFLVMTAESDGLLGLDYYLDHPVRPLERTRAGIHIAGFSLQPSVTGVSIVGPAHQSLKVLVRESSAELFRSSMGDTDVNRIDFYHSAAGFYAAHRIPSVFISSRAPRAAGDPDPAPSTDLSVAVDDTRLFFDLGQRVSTAPYWPAWRPAHDPAPHRAPPSGGSAPGKIE